MRRQEGFTLLEIIAAITIFGIILVVGTGVYYSLFHTRDAAVEKRADQHNMNMALHTLSMNIGESIQAAYREAGGRKELRLKTGIEGGYSYQSFSYDAANHTLSLYQLVGVDDSNFHNSGSSAREMKISANITDFQVSFQHKPLSDILQEGESIEIAIEFEKSDGRTESVSGKYKLLRDR